MVSVLKGKIHVVGGYFFERPELKSNVSKEHWVLDADKWRPLADAPMATGWKFDGMEAVGDKLYLIHKDLGKDHLSGVFMYTASSNSWSHASKLPAGFPDGDYATAAVGKDIYAFGGISIKNRSKSHTTVFRYSTESKEWNSSQK